MMEYCYLLYCSFRVIFFLKFRPTLQGCARDLLSRDETRDPCLGDRDETETFKILFETRPRRGVAAFETPVETLKLPRLESFNISPRRFP